MNNYVNTENYCRSCASLEDDDYATIKQYYKEGFQLNTKGKLIVNPTNVEDIPKNATHKYKQKQEFEWEGVL
jgi:hypothetical protein